MKEYRLPSGRASIEVTGGLSSEKEFTWPSKASERNLALREALEQCLAISAQEGLARLQRDLERESVKKLEAQLAALQAELNQKQSLIDDMRELCLTSGEVNEIKAQTVVNFHHDWSQQTKTNSLAQFANQYAETLRKGGTA